MKTIKQKQLAFSLAETLITLGIIGVVSAMTLPVLMTKITDSRNSSMMRQDYSILQQMMLMANDAGAIGSIVIGNNAQEMKSWFDTYFLPHIKITNVCYNKWGCWNKDVKTINGSKYQGNSICGVQTISFILNNGSYVCMDDFGDSRFGVKLEGTSIGLLVDVNGDKQPNVIGKDIFAFVFKGDKLVPGGSDMSEEEIDKNCSLTGSGAYAGTYCTAKALKQNFRLPVVP